MKIFRERRECDVGGMECGNGPVNGDDAGDMKSRDCSQIMSAEISLCCAWQRQLATMIDITQTTHQEPA